MSSKTKRWLLGSAGIAGLGALYSLALTAPPARPSQQTANAANGAAAKAPAGHSPARPIAPDQSTAQHASPSDEQGAADPQLGDPEQIAIANARKPIEERSPEIQQRYYQAWLRGLRRDQALQRGSLQRLEQQQQEAGDAKTRTVIEQQITQHRKWIDERSQQIERMESKVAPTGP